MTKLLAVCVVIKVAIGLLNALTHLILRSPELAVFVVEGKDSFLRFSGNHEVIGD
jgi:hypothetical protein